MPSPLKGPSVSFHDQFKNELQNLSKQNGLWNGYAVTNKNGDLEKVNIFKFYSEMMEKSPDSSDFKLAAKHYAHARANDTQYQSHLDSIIALSNNLGLTQDPSLNALINVQKTAQEEKKSVWLGFMSNVASYAYSWFNPAPQPTATVPEKNSTLNTLSEAVDLYQIGEGNAAKERFEEAIKSDSLEVVLASIFPENGTLQVYNELLGDLIKSSAGNQETSKQLFDFIEKLLTSQSSVDTRLGKTLVETYAKTHAHDPEILSNILDISSRVPGTDVSIYINKLIDTFIPQQDPFAGFIEELQRQIDNIPETTLEQLDEYQLEVMILKTRLEKLYEELHEKLLAAESVLLPKTITDSQNLEDLQKQFDETLAQISELENTQEPYKTPDHILHYITLREYNEWTDTLKEAIGIYSLQVDIEAAKTEKTPMPKTQEEITRDEIFKEHRALRSSKPQSPGRRPISRTGLHTMTSPTQQASASIKIPEVLNDEALMLLYRQMRALNQSMATPQNVKDSELQRVSHELIGKLTAQPDIIALLAIHSHEYEKIGEELSKLEPSELSMLIEKHIPNENVSSFIKLCANALPEGQRKVISDSVKQATAAALSSQEKNSINFLKSLISQNPLTTARMSIITTQTTEIIKRLTHTEGLNLLLDLQESFPSNRKAEWTATVINAIFDTNVGLLDEVAKSNLNKLIDFALTTNADEATKNHAKLIRAKLNSNSLAE